MKKALNKVPHKHRLWKLEDTGGLKGSILKWMEDCLRERQMRTIIRDEMSGWTVVTSGVPQGLVLASVMFLIYIKNMVEGVKSYSSLFADDTKVMRRVGGEEDCKKLQEDIDKCYNWGQEWQMELNAKKSKVLELGKGTNRPSWNYSLGSDQISKTCEEKDLGITFQNACSLNNTVTW